MIHLNFAGLTAFSSSCAEGFLGKFRTPGPVTGNWDIKGLLSLQRCPSCLDVDPHSDMISARKYDVFNLSR